MPTEKPRNKIFEEVPEGEDVSNWVRPVEPDPPIVEAESEGDADTQALALVYLADQFARGELTREQYDAAVAHLKEQGQ